MPSSLYKTVSLVIMAYMSVSGPALQWPGHRKAVQDDMWLTLNKSSGVLCYSRGILKVETLDFSSIISLSGFSLLLTDFPPGGTSKNQLSPTRIENTFQCFNQCLVCFCSKKEDDFSNGTCSNVFVRVG